MLSMFSKNAQNFSHFVFYTSWVHQTTPKNQEFNNTGTPQSVAHTNYIHLPIPPWLMRGMVTFKMYGSINVLLRKILMTPRVSTVTYTKNSYFRSRPYGRPFVPVDTDSVIHKLLVLLVLQYWWCTWSVYRASRAHHSASLWCDNTLKYKH